MDHMCVSTCLCVCQLFKGVMYTVDAEWLSAGSSPTMLSASLALEKLWMETFWKSGLLSVFSHQLLSPSSADT
ncbi:hypothetical protein CHARACLAT_010456 [Characodon lateralis]|uniref:Uncharacterized protein n=1 Tax=Characodon lateralis TaxID=208331 RepID=A0ABU7E0Z8_9TELE|nr:hypothetical protein [Characodon lateralis]